MTKDEIAERWGGMSYSEISRMLGVSPERVRQIEKTALQKLRRWVEMQVCRNYRQYWEDND